MANQETHVLTMLCNHFNIDSKVAAQHACMDVPNV
jgi:hypothetical protein